jgi:dephospho-CoA kinase
MLLIGLTCSIATVKSTVSSILNEPPYSLPIIDADLLARKVVEPGTAGYKAVVSYFGPSTPGLLVPADPADNMPEDGPDGLGRPLNRPVLGRRIFGDDAQRKKDRAVLNGIIHPAVRREMFWEVVRCYFRGERAVVLDIPLLYESRLDLYCGTVMVVAVRERKVQLERLMARDAHLSREDAENRIGSQVDVREKARRCLERGGARGVVVWNAGGKDELKAELRKAMDEVEASSPKWWSVLLLACPPLAVALATWGVVRNGLFNWDWEVREKHARARL